MSEQEPAAERRVIDWVWRVLHVLIIANFIVQIFYCGYVLFVSLAPPGGGGPLWGRAASVDLDLLMRRRMYGIEAWIAIVGLSVYLAITEISPRLARRD